ncbi:hypothetical protein HPB51_016279 [Rhipicephalus microplus]|uniref:Uncharacterized protein n=1 Tax=Rhipicephalus microplus TaxID=6941 RepID=A0A9J6ETA8_RHIMP|nr:hypothetical protein HPB51_016279 [Rhipicephalus microplus]
MYLENVKKTALQPQQRLVVLRFYLLPRLYHRLILGPVSRKHLMRLDKIIRSSVRDWLKLPHDVPLGAFHARVPHGGLGIPSLRTVIPYLRLRRLNALALSEYGACKEAHKMKYIQDLVRQSEAMLLYKGSVINSKKANQKFWTNYFLGSADGAALKEVDNAPGASAWVAEGTRFLSVHTVPPSAASASASSGDGGCRSVLAGEGSRWRRFALTRGRSWHGDETAEVRSTRWRNRTLR